MGGTSCPGTVPSRCGEHGSQRRPGMLDGCQASNILTLTWHRGGCRRAWPHPRLCLLLPSQPEEPSTWTSYMGKMLMAATNYLPTQVSDMMNQDRAFATGRLGFSGHRNICTLSTYVQRPPSPGTNHYRFASPKHRFTCPRHTRTGLKERQEKGAKKGT